MFGCGWFGVGFVIGFVLIIGLRFTFAVCG